MVAAVLALCYFLVDFIVMTGMLFVMPGFVYPCAMVMIGVGGIGIIGAAET